MVKYTPNYNLGKPEGTDMYSVLPQNSNMDILDSVLKNVETDASSAKNDSASALDRSLEVQQLLTNLMKESLTCTTVDITYYVSPNGDDNNDGLSSATSFKSISKALSLLPQTINHTVTINIEQGIYPEDVNLVGYIGQGIIKLNGGTDIVSAQNYVINKISVLGSTLQMSINGITCNESSSGVAAFTVGASSYVEFNHCVSNTDAGLTYGFFVTYGNCTINNCLLTNKYTAIYVSKNSIVFSNSNSGTGNTVGITSLNASTVGKSGTQPSGTTVESTSNGGVIR